MTHDAGIFSPCNTVVVLSCRRYSGPVLTSAGDWVWSKTPCTPLSRASSMSTASLQLLATISSLPVPDCVRSRPPSAMSGYCLACTLSQASMLVLS